MNRLCISDLDGTLLNGDQTVSEETVKLLNGCVSRGMNFTFATARTAASAVKITEGININAPCILMNGVSIYDIPECRYVKVRYLPEEKAEAVAELLDRLGQNGFMYKITGDKLGCFYHELDTPELEEFYSIRRNRFDKPFTQVESYGSSCDGDVIYFALMDSFEKLDIIRNEAEKLGGLKYEFYKDIYNSNIWYLEIFSDKASKYNGVRFLREEYGFDEIVCFGDNLNDIPMFRASDIRVAVENAKPEVKELADFIARSNTENGVARWLCENPDVYMTNLS